MGEFSELKYFKSKLTEKDNRSSGYFELFMTYKYLREITVGIKMNKLPKELRGKSEKKKGREK